jgi:hypothetical protein
MDELVANIAKFGQGFSYLRGNQSLLFQTPDRTAPYDAGRSRGKEPAQGPPSRPSGASSSGALTAVLVKPAWVNAASAAACVRWTVSGTAAVAGAGGPGLVGARGLASG